MIPTPIPALAPVESVAWFVAVGFCVGENAPVLGGMVEIGVVGVGPLEACDVTVEPIVEPMVEAAALRTDEIICRTFVSVDCHRTCMMSAHIVGPATMARFTVTRLGLLGIGPNP